MIGEDDVRKVANLARLELSEEDTGKMTKELGAILGYFEQLTNLDLSNVDATSQAFGVTNVYREDELQPGLSEHDLKGIAPDVSGRFIKVPLIVE